MAENTTKDIWNDDDGAKEPPKKRHMLRKFLIFLLVLIAVLGLVLVAAWRDGTGFDALRRYFAYGTEAVGGEKTVYHYDTDNTNRFARVGTGSLVILSDTSLRLLGPDGSEVWSANVKMNAPALGQGGGLAVAYDIGGTALYVLDETGPRLELTSDGAELIARLADGALRDALSILDTCAGVDNHVDEALVRRMAGVTDRGYLFEISDAIAAGDSVTALEKIAELRQQSVDMRRLCMELAGHYRNLMLCALPGGTSLLTGISPEEEAAYTQRRDFPQREAIRAVNAFGSALEKMSRGTDQRIELELAIFSLTQPETAAAPVIIQQPALAAPAAPQAFASAPRAYTAAPPVQAAPSVVPPVVQPQSVPAAAPDDVPPPIDDDPPFLQPELKPAPQQPPAPVPPAPAAPAPRKPEPPRQAGPLEPFAFWPAVLADLEENDAMLISFLRGTRAYCDGKRVLFECSDAFRDYIRNNREVSKRLKETIYRVSRTKYSIGPYEEPKTDDTTAAVSLDETLHTMQSLGVDLKIVDK